MTAQNSRKTFLDLLRIIACFLVIVNHTNSNIFLSRTPESVTWFISITYFFISKTAVPVFFMISGYLLLSRQDSWKKTFGRILRISIVLVGCAFVYAVYNGLSVEPNASAGEILREWGRVFTKTPSNALWYLYTYLGLLLMMPFLQKMAALMEKKDYYIFFAISGIFVSLFPIITHYVPSFTYNYNFQLPLFGGYVCMLFLGQYFARFGLKRTKTGLFTALAVFAVSVTFNVTATYFEFQNSADSYLFFDNRVLLPIVAESVCVFYIATFLEFSGRLGKVISYLGACTFGIYLISDLFIDLAQPLHAALGKIMHPLPAVLLFEFFVFLCGLSVTALLRRLPYIKNIL